MTIHLDKGGDLNDPNNDRCHIFIPGEYFLTATNCRPISPPGISKISEGQCNSKIFKTNF